MGATATTGVGVQAGAPQVPTTKGAMALGQALTVSETVGRVRLLFPPMKAAAMDTVLHQMLFSELLSQVEHGGRAVVLPMHLQVHTVEAHCFREYKNQFSGLMTENVDKVYDHIAALGLYTGPVSEAAVA